MTENKLEEKVKEYIGGQMEIQNSNEGYLYRGEIKKIEVKNKELNVQFSWVAKGVGFPPGPKKWVVDSNRDYKAGLEIYSVSYIGDNRICLQCPYTGELAVLFHKDGSKLDPAKVEGL